MVSNDTFYKIFTINEKPGETKSKAGGDNKPAADPLPPALGKAVPAKHKSAKTKPVHKPKSTKDMKVA